MFKQFYTITIRNIFNDKLLSSINFLNLVVGFATFILITLFVQSELTWDKHNKNYKRIYRVQLFMDQSENVEKHTWSTTAALSRHVLNNLPEVEKLALMHDVGDNNKDGIFLSLDKKNQYKVRWGYYVDPSVFQIFTFHFLEGNPNDALKEPYSIVLCKSVADKLFPANNALGKQVYGENKVTFTVKGVYEDLPKNSDWLPSYLLPMNTFTQVTGWKDYEDNFWAYSFSTYVLLKPNTDPATVDHKIFDALKDYRKEHHPYLRPLSVLHTNPQFKKDLKNVLILLSFIALLILVLAAINYINLQTARASTRLKEIGIKKTVGFSKHVLYLQFLYESVLISFLSGLLAVVVAQMVLPLFSYLISNNGILGSAITSNVFSQPEIVLLVLLVSLFTGLISGLYPAYIISSYNPIKALKGKVISEQSGGFGLKKILITVQFCISLFLLIVSFIIYLQTQYNLTGNLGFNSREVVFANLVTTKNGSFEPLRQKLIQHPEIKNTCFSDYIPFIIPGGDDLSWEGGETEENVFFRRYNVTYDFFSTYNIPIVKGRSFSKEFPDDFNKCVINETAVRVCGWNDPIGKHIINGDKKIEVIGVIKDYISQSMHNPVEPHWYHLMLDSASLNGIYSVAYSGDTKKTMEIIKNDFSEFFPEDAFEFTHIQNIIQDENANKAWKVIRNVSVFFAMLSIIISTAGLFGLVMFYSRKKMKEIGIRKVLGFSSRDLYIKLSSEFLWLLLIANIIAWPASYCVYIMLPGAHKYNIQVWEFLQASSIILLVAVITISYHIIKLIRINPVETLKYE